MPTLSRVNGSEGTASVFAAGVIFAGVTDICDMGMQLARMPLNQVG